MTLDSIDNCSTTEAATTRVERSLLIFSLSQAQGMLSKDEPQVNKICPQFLYKP